MEDCFRDTPVFGARYERAKSNSRADVHATEAPAINEVNPQKNQGCGSNAVDHISRGHA